MYKLTQAASVIRLTDNACIPADPANADYQVYLAWKAGENTPAPAETKAEIQERMWEVIKEKRDGLQVAGCQVAGHWFHNDIKSRSQWERMANKSQKLLNAGASLEDSYLINGAPAKWKTMTGEFIPLALGLIQQVVDEFEQQECRIFVAAETHKAQMMASADPANYDYSAGWPAAYPG